MQVVILCQGTIGEYKEDFFILKIPDIGMPTSSVPEHSTLGARV